MPQDTIFRATGIANYLIEKGKPTGLDPLQIMKLTYIAHGFALALLDSPLIEEDVEAWKLGPVIRRIYTALPGGPSPITVPLAGLPAAEPTGDQKSVVDGVYANYGSLSGIRLSALTHAVDSPWEQTWRTYGKNAVIPKELIKSHYQKVISDWREAANAGRPFSVTAL